MSTPVVEEFQHDEMAMSVARALAVANEAALAAGLDPTACLVTVAEDLDSPERRWRVHYGPRDYFNVRGGDLIVVVGDRDGNVEGIIRGQ